RRVQPGDVFVLRLRRQVVPQPVDAGVSHGVSPPTRSLVLTPNPSPRFGEGSSEPPHSCQKKEIRARSDTSSHKPSEEFRSPSPGVWRGARGSGGEDLSTPGPNRTRSSA